MDVKGVFKTVAEAEGFSKVIETSHGYFGEHIAFLFEMTHVRPSRN